MTAATPPFITPADAETATGVPIAGAEGLPEAPETTVPPITPEDRQAAITEAYGAATKMLREKYRDEAVAFQKAQLAERGIDWTPSLTKTERAKAAAVKLLTDAGVPVPAELA